MRIAEYENKVIAALLVFLYNQPAEYYTPVILNEYRPLQPMSGLIYQAMQEAITCGMKWWNWGGTWKSQDGVYRFKKSWGYF